MSASSALAQFPEQIIAGQLPIAVVGLGYVGLPIALEFAKKYKVIGFDINEHRLELMRQGIDPSKELQSADFQDRNIVFSSDLEVLKSARVFIVAVPTPIDKHSQPDLKPLIGASTTIGKCLKQGDIVIYESTVYPGCTEEDCVPVLEEESGLKFVADFSLGYSPERINPGDKNHTLTTITKVVSGHDAEASEFVAWLYGSIVTAGVFRASSIKVAEAAKVIENTQRDLNIALMNELSQIFDLLGINTYEVLEAAGTKWNFIKLNPGLVGGHCIGVDPYYLTYKSKALGYEPRVILSGRAINDGMGEYIARRSVQKIAKLGKDISRSKALVMGVTFKENVSDIRNTRIDDLVQELRAYGMQVDVVDPYADPEEWMHEYNYPLQEKPGREYDIVLVAVSHQQYRNLTEDFYKWIMTPNGLVVDVKGLYRNQFKDLHYWSL